MISASEQVTKLRALLDRIQQRASEPRVARFIAVPEVEIEEREPTLPGHSAAAVEAPIEPAMPAPIEAAVIEPPVEAPVVEPPPPSEEVREAATLEEAPIEPAIVIAEPEFEHAETATPEEAHAAPIEAAPVEPGPTPATTISDRPIEEPILTEAEEHAERVEAVSGEFAVAEVPMELEELGPADEIHEDEHIVEIQVEEEPVAALSPVVEEGRPAEDIVAVESALPLHEEPEPEEERISEPPASGRELVATPYESQRLAVAAPATPDQHALDLAEEPEPPPESSRNLRAAPEVPTTSDVIELQPSMPARVEPLHIEPEPQPEPPIEELHAEPQLRAEQPLESEPAPAPSIEPVRLHVEEPEAAPPQQVAVAVSLAAAPRPVEHVVVGVDADVIHAELTPADVASFIGAARAPRPETFGVLLDAALDL